MNPILGILHHLTVPMSTAITADELENNAIDSYCRLPSSIVKSLIIVTMSFKLYWSFIEKTSVMQDPNLR